jgi:hypothetical protein
MPFVEGHAHVGHVITNEDRAKGHLNAQRAMEKKKDLKLDDLKASTSWLLGKLFDNLQQEVDANGKTKWEAILDESKGKDIAVMFGILTEKYLLTQGQPTTIMAHQEQKTMDEIALAIDREIKRRGLIKRPVSIEALAETVK